MIELPEALTLARQLQQTLCGKTVCRVLPPVKPHKFCWFSGEPTEYEAKIRNSTVTGATAFGMCVELYFDNGCRLCVNDGVNLRLLPEKALPSNYQLAISLSDGNALVLTVSMYGGILLLEGSYEEAYYQKSKKAVSPFSDSFREHFAAVLQASSPKLSAKAFLATEQRFPGIGNGVAQDILLAAGLHPRRKLQTLSCADTDRLCAAIVGTLQSMTDGGGRNTEKDLFGQPGGYVTKMSKTATACPVCGGAIVKEAYLGGSVYYCLHCQPL